MLVEKLRTSPIRQQPRMAKKEKFIPQIPLSVFQGICIKGAKADLSVFITLWFLKGVTHKNSFKFEHARAKECSLSNSTVQRSLKNLERIGLIKLQNRKGKSPYIEFTVENFLQNLANPSIKPGSSLKTEEMGIHNRTESSGEGGFECK